MINYSEFGVVLDQISSVMRKALNQHQHQFDIDSEVYRRDLYNDWKLFERNIPDKNTKILDCGCGKGHHTAALAGFGYKNITGIDLSETSGEGGIYNKETLGSLWQLPLWEKLGSQFGTNYLFYDGNTTPFKNETFDVVLLYAVIEHVDLPETFLQECSRILKPGGKILIYRCPNRFSYTEALAKWLGLPHHEKMYAKQELTQLFRGQGFERLILQRYDNFPSFFPIKRWQQKYDSIMGKLAKFDFIFSPTFMNIISHHYRGVFKKDQ